MLKKLRIQNYAIIDELSISFSEMLNIITGETGAGKSILMGALDLVLGKRADVAVLKNKEKKCIVETVFFISEGDIKSHLADHDLDADDEIVIRREITSNGKSRSFINDTPVNLVQLKSISSMLVDLHRQFDTAEIGTEHFQRMVIDAVADNAALLTEMRSVYGAYNTLRNEVERLRELQLNADKEADYNRFLLEEFVTLNLQWDELENLDAELKLLSNAETIKLQLQSVYGILKNGDDPITQSIKAAAQKLNGLREYHSDVEELHNRLTAAQIEIQDVADELENIDEHISHDAERINTVNERLSAGYRLLKKHGVTATAQLISIREELESKLDAVLNISNTAEKKEAEAAVLLKEAEQISKKLHDRRDAQTKPFTEKVNALLLQIGMPNARLKIELQPAGLSAYGRDAVVFLFDANVPAGKTDSKKFEPLYKVASGGELSRLMLCVKSLVAQKLALPVLIFDEIDTGISGEAARQVGMIMKSLAGSHQVISITHQPQIAAKASAHYFVYKEIVDDAIQTSIRLLTPDERILAVAKMLSGEKPTAAAMANAKELMN